MNDICFVVVLFKYFFLLLCGHDLKSGGIMGGGGQFVAAT